MAGRLKITRWFKRARRKVGDFVQRGRRGWAISDTWNYDRYLAGQISEVLTHLAYRGMGYPGQPPFDTAKKWRNHLMTIVARFKRYVEMEDCETCLGCPWKPEDTCHATAYKDAQAAFHDLADIFSQLWD